MFFQIDVIDMCKSSLTGFIIRINIQGARPLIIDGKGEDGSLQGIHSPPHYVGYGLSTSYPTLTKVRFLKDS